MEFEYGTGQPHLLCAPWRTCQIILQEGEELLDKAGGDLVRWKVWAILGPANSQIVAIRPLFCDVSTNLFFTTTKRIYDVMLDSPPCGGADVDSTKINVNLPYTTALRFTYPEDEVRGSAFNDPRAGRKGGGGAVLEEGGEGRPGGGGRGVTPGGGVEPRDPLAGAYMNYEVSFDPGFPWRPTYVYDNGVETFIHLPEKARRGELPVLYEVSATGEPVMVNYDFDPAENRYTAYVVSTRLMLQLPRPDTRNGGLRLVLRRIPPQEGR